MPTKLISTGVQFPDDSIQTSAATGVPAGIITIWSGSTASVPSGWALCDGANGTPDLRDRFIVGAGSAYAVGATGGSNTVTLDETQIPGHTHFVSGNTDNTGAHTHNVSGNTSNAGAHSHTGSTSNNGSHTHGLTAITFGYNGNSTSGTYIIGRTGLYALNSNVSRSNSNLGARSSGSHSHNFSTSNTGAHSHTLSGTADSDGAHSHSISITSDSTGGGNSHENRPPYYALAYIMKL